MKKKNISFIVLGVCALVIVTISASFAFFNYSKIGRTKTTITTGDLEFSYFEAKDHVIITDQYPLADEYGKNDSSHDYKFEVGLRSSSTSSMSYNVKLISNNKDASLNYFKNQNIKYALLRSEDDTTYTFVGDTDSDPSKVLSDIEGFDIDSTEGVGSILSDQNILSNQKHYYKLRIWISDQTNYSNTVDGQDAPTSTGKFNNYTYSLKVRVEATDSNSVSAKSIGYSNVNSPNNCQDLECSLNELFEMVN